MKQITIDDLIPLLKTGWVAMDKWGRWWWFKLKPKKVGILWDEQPSDEDYCPLNSFDIAPVEDWEKSLRKVADYQKDTNKLADSNSENRVYKKEEV